MIKLRDYQKRLVDDVCRELKTHDNVLVESPTGSGKRIIFCHLISEWNKQDKKIIILVHTNELKHQISDHLDEIGVEHGFIHRYKDDSEYNVRIAMVRTLHNRIKKEIHYKADYLIVDEAHHSTAAQWYKIIHYYKHAKIIGFTATPFRSDGMGLATCFETIVSGLNIAELIKKNHLSGFAFYSPTDLKIDLSKIKVIGGEYSPKELEKRINKPFITGKAIEHYKKYSDGKSAIVFCISVEHALSVTKEFKNAGIKAEAIYGDMYRSGSTISRNKVIDGYTKGDIKVLVSVDLLCEGFDVPHTETIIMLRPNYSLGRYLQSIGRGLRSHKDKKETLILDTVGNVFKHGFPDEDRKYSLEGLTTHLSNLTQCPKCHHVHKPARICPKCGFKYTQHLARGSQPYRIIQQPGYLKRLEREELIKLNKERRTLFLACTTAKDFLEYGKKYNFSKVELWANNQYGKYKKEKALANGQPMGSQWCGACSSFKPDIDFNKKGIRCKPCQKAHRQRYYEKNKGKEIARSYVWTKKNPIKVLESKRKARQKAKILEKGWAKRSWDVNKASQMRYYQKNKEKILAEKRDLRKKQHRFRLRALNKWAKDVPVPTLSVSDKRMLRQREVILKLAAERKEKRAKAKKLD